MRSSTNLNILREWLSPRQKNRFQTEPHNILQNDLIDDCLQYYLSD
jgi:hypothetical protein